jgi:predicted small secreted protein
MKYLTLIPLLAMMILSACETVQGAGRDLQTAGEAITEESQQSQAKY